MWNVTSCIEFDDGVGPLRIKYEIWKKYTCVVFCLKYFHLFKLGFGQKSLLNISRTNYICNNIFPTFDIFPTWDIFTTFGIFVGLINFDIITTRYCYDIDIIKTRYCYDIDIITISILLRHWYIVQGYNTTKGSYLSIQRYYCYSNNVPG